MLFLHQENFIEIVREQPYKNLLTVMATNQAALREFIFRTPSKIMPLVHPINRWMIHVGDTNLGIAISPEALDQVEVVDRLTGEPSNFHFQYSYLDLEGKTAIGKGYCWAEELEQTLQQIEATEPDLIGEIICTPLFRVNRSLITPKRPENPNNNSNDSEDNQD
jgi:hypothetical protein